MSKDIRELLKEACVPEQTLDFAASTESVYLFYPSEKKDSVYVEIAAPNFAKLLLKLPCVSQRLLIVEVLKLVPEVGDHENITDNQDRDKKQLGARVIHMRSEEEGHKYLLITR